MQLPTVDFVNVYTLAGFMLQTKHYIVFRNGLKQDSVGMTPVVLRSFLVHGVKGPPCPQVQESSFSTAHHQISDDFDWTRFSSLRSYCCIIFSHTLF